jgi:hypothetical protein
VSAQPGILLADFSFQADARGQDQGEGEFPGLPPSLAVERACGGGPGDLRADCEHPASFGERQVNSIGLEDERTSVQAVPWRLAGRYCPTLTAVFRCARRPARTRYRLRPDGICGYP